MFFYFKTQLQAKIMLSKLTIFILILCMTTQAGFSQTYAAVGILKDSKTTDSFKTNAVISILRQTDSSLVKFTRSNTSGNFKLNGLPKGNYIILITYPKYADYVELFALGTSDIHDFKTIHLSRKATLLQEIIVKQTAIRIKGDTTEYKADSFRVKPNASVEDLLKELQGIQVDKNGRITAQGQPVQKILVDGEEFFGDDPTIATRNIRADAIDKVQVFDKKSDQSSFTGIDDGQTTKTINLELKDNARRGYFGKLAVAALDQYYNSQAFINSFKGKRKLSAFVVASSTEKTGLNFEESSSYGFDNDQVKIDEGSGTIFISSEGGDELGTQSYAGEGLPESIKAGLLFSNKWNREALSINGNYLFNKLAEHGAANTFRQNILKDSLYYNHENLDRYSDKLRHTLSGIFETQLDSSSSLKITARGHAGIFEHNDYIESEALTADNQLANNSIRNSTRKGDNLSIEANALYRKRFKKKGRTISLNVNSKYYESAHKSYLQNESFFYLNFIQKDTTDQYKRNSADQNIFTGRITYTEPLSDRSFLEMNYSYNNNHSSIKRETYNKDIHLKFSVLIDSLSNDFDYRVNTHSAGVNYRFNEKKYYFSFGGNVANTHFNQTDLVKDSSRKYDYTNLFPQAVFNYKFNPYSNLNIRYTGITNQPTIHQLQPIKNNNDPLNIIVGNPNLKQEFENSLQIGYTNYQVLNERYLILSSFLIHTSNMISSSYDIDLSGKRIYQAVNVDDGYAVALGGGYSIKIPNTLARLAFGPSLNYSKYSNIINGLTNSTNTTNLLLRVNVKMSKKDQYDLYATLIPSINKSTSSISAASATSFTNYNFNTGGNVTLPAKFEAGTDININLREKVNKYDVNNNVILLNAYVEKKFLKNDVLTLRLSINDILNQNKGYDRYITPFYSEEKTYLTFKRYGLIGLTYNFVNKGGKVSTEDGTIRL